MGNSRNITDTDSRLLEGLTGISERVYDNKNVDVQISNAVTDSMITTARLVKYYPSLNKCKVQLDNNGEYVFCTVLLLMGGDVMFLYTPLGDRSFCEELREPCVIPRGLHRVFVAPINNQEEWLMLGYYYPNEFVGFNPSKSGQFKILAFGSLGEYSIRFGVDGLEIVSNGEIVKSEIDDFGEDVSTNTYSSEEIDELLASYDTRLKELEDKLTETNTDNMDNASNDDNANNDDGGDMDDG
jgi:hypothetical protein